MVPMFRYLLVLPDGEPHDKASWATVVPNWMDKN
jgi:hypothetical protein